jgi:hypothetical protein
MRRFILSTLALAALSLPAAAQERVCREPHQMAVDFTQRQQSQRPTHSWHPPPPQTMTREWAIQNSGRPTFDQTVRADAMKVFDRAFKEHCKAGDVISLAPAFQSFAKTHCDLNRPTHHVGNTVICFAQVPPRE